MAGGMKACPLCASPGYIQEDSGRFYAACTSLECFCTVGEAYDRDAVPEHQFTTEGDALEAWNKRASSAPMTATAELVGRQDMLFDALPAFPVALPDDELRMLASLPEWPSTQEVFWEERATARSLEKRSLIKITRQKMDPVASDPDWFAGKLPAANLQEASR